MSPAACASCCVQLPRTEVAEHEQDDVENESDDDLPEVAPADPTKMEEVIANMEGEQVVRAEIASVMSDAMGVDSEKQQKLPSTAGTCKQQQDAIGKHPLTLQAILAKMEPDLDTPPPPKEDSEAKVVLRAKKLHKPLAEFVRAVRARENFVPKASVQCDDGEPANKHNRMEQKLAVARQEFQISAVRRTRFQMWAGFAEKCVQIVKPPEANATPVAVAPSDFRPSCLKADAAEGPGERVYQVLIARSCVDEGIRLVVVESVFRGALAQQKSTRASRVTKPHAESLPQCSPRRTQSGTSTPATLPR